MAKHEVELKIAHEIPVGNKDIEIPVKVDDAPFGRLKISRGGIDWLPTARSKRSHALTWEQFAEIVVREGKAK